MSGKHAETRPAERPHDSAEVDPGIGRSKGTTISGQDPRLIEGESTFPGDVENETNAQGGIDPDRTGRTTGSVPSLPAPGRVAPPRRRR